MASTTKVGKLRAEMEVDSKRFNSGIKSAKKSLTGIQKSFGILKTSLIGLVGVGGFLTLAKQSLNFADAIGKSADRIGIATGQLQELRFAFDKAGIATETTDQALLIFGKRLGKARQGIGALVSGLKRGKEALLEKLKATRNTSEALEVMFKALGEAKTQTERLSIADAAFGGAGLKMTAAFLDAGKSFNVAREEALKLGIVIEDKLIRNAELTNDKLSALSQIISTKVKSAFLALAPTIDKVADALISFSEIINKLFKSTDGTNLSQAFENVQADIKKTEQFLGDFSTKLDAALFGDDLVNEAKQRLESLKIVLKGLDEAGKLEEAQKGVRDLGNVAETTSAKFKVLAGDFREIGSDKRLGELKALFDRMKALEGLDLNLQFGFSTDPSS